MEIRAWRYYLQLAHLQGTIINISCYKYIYYTHAYIYDCKSGKFLIVERKVIIPYVTYAVVVISYNIKFNYWYEMYLWNILIQRRVNSNFHLCYTYVHFMQRPKSIFSISDIIKPSQYFLFPQIHFHSLKTSSHCIVDW